MFIYVHGAKCSLKHPKKTNACHNAMPSGCRRSSFSCWIHKFLSCVATGSDVFVGFSLDPKWHHVCVWIYIYIYYTYSCWSQCRNDLWMYIFVFLQAEGVKWCFTLFWSYIFWYDQKIITMPTTGAKMITKVSSNGTSCFFPRFIQTQ